MIHFFKPKSYLRDLIPNDHIDIHSHLLPAIDDGAKTIEDTFFLISELQKIGFEQFITTPHIMENIWDNTVAIISSNFINTSEALKKNNYSVPLRFAAEYMMDDSFTKNFQNNPLLTLKDNYVLVEMSYLNAPMQLYDIIFELQVAGYIPVLAHPERYSFYHSNFNEYQKLKNSGCKFQINLLSTVGYYGLNVATIAKKLLSNGMIDFAGSDVHHKNHLDGFTKKLLLKDLNPLKEAIANNQFFRF